MANSMTYQFEPDYAVHPGEILEETLGSRSMSRAALARRCQLAPKTISQIVNGKAPITPETAIQFERVLGVSARVWSNLDTNYKLHVARRAARRKLTPQTAWAQKFPFKEIVKRGLVENTRDPVGRVERLLDFFGVGSIKAWNQRVHEMSVAYRRSPSFKSSLESVAAWLRIGELFAQNIETEEYSRQTFKNALYEIRGLTSRSPQYFEPEMRRLCADSGVALVFVSEFPGTHLSGATRWLNTDKAMIVLSLRHKKDDHFWFTFFHEAGHILLHGKKKVFLDEVDPQQNDEEEAAGRFAMNLLIPEDEYRAFVARGRCYPEDIQQFARRIDIAPGIVVGRLQHNKNIRWQWHNKLKRTFTLVESEE